MDKEILYRKLKRLQTMVIIFNDSYPDIANKLQKAHTLLSDPSTNLDIIPRESINEESTDLQLKMGKTSKENRELFKLMLLENIKKDKDLIKRKIRNFKFEDENDMVAIASCLKVIRKILAGMTSELNTSNDRMGEHVE